MLMAAAVAKVATVLMAQVATGEMVETVLLVVEAMEVTVPLKAAEVVLEVKDLEEMGAAEIMETRDKGI